MLGVMEKKRKPGRPKDPNSKRSRGVSRYASPRESFHLPEELRAAMLRFLGSSRPSFDKSKTLRTALEEFLERRGFWPPPSPPE